MRYRIRTITVPGEEPALPFEVAEAKAHLRVDHADDDALIEAQLRAAVDWVERFTGQVLTERVLELAADGFPRWPELISLPREPVTGIVSVAYTGTDGEAVTMDAADWRWSEDAPDQLLPAYRAAWPAAAAEAGSVRVRFEAGYGEGLAPPALVLAVKQALTVFYERRSGDAAAFAAAADLCRPFRRMMI